MKFVVFVNVVFGASAALQLVERSTGSSFRRKHASLAPGEPVLYGDTRCPCIGFDNIEGDTVLQLEDADGEKMQVSYPADVGAHCRAWDNKHHPQCKSGKEPWCSQQWCYVDACNCNLDVLPKMSTFMPDVTYRGKPLFWSAETCGGKDMFTTKKPALGNSKCRCIGFAGVAGSMDITLAGEEVEYPADLGSTCKAWDHKVHPECRGDDAPSWCRANWCYVDPCECDLPKDVVPKISAYLPLASFTGKNLYYSYETCGSQDSFTKKNNPDACVNQRSEAECKENYRCSWTGSKCLGSELVNHPLCKQAGKKMMDGKAHSGAAAQALSTFILMLASVMATCA